jgi:hypothetical protein
MLRRASLYFGSDQLRMRLAIDVELIFPEQASHDQTPKLKLRGQSVRLCAFVRGDFCGSSVELHAFSSRTSQKQKSPGTTEQGKAGLIRPGPAVADCLTEVSLSYATANPNNPAGTGGLGDPLAG